MNSIFKSPIITIIIWLTFTFFLIAFDYILRINFGFDNSLSGWQFQWVTILIIFSVAGLLSYKLFKNIKHHSLVKKVFVFFVVYSICFVAYAAITLVYTIESGIDSL